jgi:hypothetical protein
MKLNALLGFFCLLLGACSGNGLAAVKPSVDVEIVNQSARDLQNAGARFGEHACEWGFVGKTFTKIYLFYPHPITAHAELQWDEPSGRRVEKLDLSKIYSRGKSGRLTFTVHDDRVEVNFREKS